MSAKIGSILDDFIAASKLPSVCKMSKWLNTLSKEDREKFESLKNENSRVDIKNLYEALIAAGHNIPAKLTAFRSHFKGYCTCNKNQ